MRTGLTKQEKTTDIWFDEKDPLIHIRTHNTDLKKRLLAYSRRYPAICQQMDADPETGCMEFDIAKGRFSFRLTAPYSEERREATRRYARENSTTNLLKYLSFRRIILIRQICCVYYPQLSKNAQNIRNPVPF